MALHLKSTGIDFTDFGDASATGSSTSSELLDDYEEGTWTPSFIDNAASTGTTSMTGSVGAYIKIGKMVHVQFYWFVNSITTAPSGLYAGVGGLPFTLANDSGYDNSGMAGTYSNINVPDGAITVLFERNKAHGLFYSQKDNANYSTISPDEIAASDTFYGTVTYRAA